MNAETFQISDLYKILRVYSFEIGMPLLTVEDIENALSAYLHYAPSLN